MRRMTHAPMAGGLGDSLMRRLRDSTMQTDLILDADATPLCLGCLAPVSPLQHYCDECGACVGRFTPCLPFELIPYYAQFFGALWDRLWFSKRASLPARVLYVLIILLVEPLMLLALPFTLLSWRRIFRRRHHLCPSCGYRLEELGEAGRCPECSARFDDA